MDIFELIEQMNDFINRKDWQGLISKHKQLCNYYAGPEIENKISSIDIKSYESNLKHSFQQSIAVAINIHAVAIYFEYNLDNLWDGDFFICKQYIPYAKSLETKYGDDWACYYETSVEGPRFEEFADLYDSSFDKNDQAIVINTYLMAITVASFGKIAHSYNTKDLAICIAFHDQDPIMRIKEKLL